MTFGSAERTASSSSSDSETEAPGTNNVMIAQSKFAKKCRWSYFMTQKEAREDSKQILWVQSKALIYNPIHPTLKKSEMDRYNMESFATVTSWRSRALTKKMSDFSFIQWFHSSNLYFSKPVLPPVLMCVGECAFKFELKMSKTVPWWTYKKVHDGGYSKWKDLHLILGGAG